MAANSLISTSIEHPPIELLSLLILDDERAVREGCRDAAVSLGGSRVHDLGDLRRVGEALDHVPLR